MLERVADLEEEIEDDEPEARRYQPNWNNRPMSPRTITVDKDSDDFVNATKIYLDEISQHPLLKAEQEVELAKDHEQGRLAKSKLANNGVLSPPEVADLQKAVVCGEMARKKLTESNLRLVVSVAKRYLGRGVALLDLIQEGNIGLYRAVDKFDWRRGFKLSTYATWWIRQAITRATADQSRNIRIPVHMAETINKITKVSRELVQELGREPTYQEIAEAAGVTLEKVQGVFLHAQDTISLNTTVGEDDEMELSDRQVSDGPTPYDEVEKELFKEQVATVLDRLSLREQFVLRSRAGMYDGRRRTLEEVGKEIGVTRERARQIEAKALRRLRHPANSKDLKHLYFS